MTSDRQAQPGVDSKPLDDRANVTGAVTTGPDNDPEAGLPPREERPLVTFAVFAYNQEKYIREAVEGAFSQTYEPLEIILSDDCSTDRTFEIMQEMAAAYDGPHIVRVRRNDVNFGLAMHINHLVRDARGEIICWAAGDDVSLPERTARLVHPIQSNKAIMGVHSSVLEIDTDGQFLRRRNVSKRTKNINMEGVCRYGDSIISQSHAFRKMVFEVFGDLMSELTNEGPVMAFRELSLGSVEFVDEALVLYRIGSGVSTYNGGEYSRMKYVEPVKISEWRRSAFDQISRDVSAYNGGLRDGELKQIRKNRAFFRNLNMINRKRRVIVSVFANFVLKPFDFSSCRAALRVASPACLYCLFCK